MEKMFGQIILILSMCIICCNCQVECPSKDEFTVCRIRYMSHNGKGTNGTTTTKHLCKCPSPNVDISSCPDDWTLTDHIETRNLLNHPFSPYAFLRADLMFCNTIPESMRSTECSKGDVALQLTYDLGFLTNVRSNHCSCRNQDPLRHVKNWEDGKQEHDLYVCPGVSAVCGTDEACFDMRWSGIFRGFCDCRFGTCCQTSVKQPSGHIIGKCV